MIYQLVFPRLYEWSNSNSANSKILESVHNLLPSSLLLYRYNVRKSIPNRFGVSGPEKINFDLIKQKSIVIYHLSIYKEKPEKINDLIKFCIENDKDLIIPTQGDDFFRNKNFRKDRVSSQYGETIDYIESCLDGYDYQYYDMSKDGSFLQLKRELIISSL
jgi:hypothetical protein